MGRKPKNKKRINDPELRAMWANKLMPVYMASGLKKFTMDDISDKLGVSKATLYKHFSSRLEILESVVRQKIKEIASFEENLMDEEIPYLVRYRKAVKNASLKLAGISTQFLLDLKELYPDLWQKVMSLQYFAAERAKAFYQEGIDKGVLRGFDAQWLATTDKIFIMSLSNPEFLVENKLTLKKAFDDYFLMKSQGIFKNDISDE